MASSSTRFSPRGLISLFLLFVIALVLPAQPEQSPEELIKQLGSPKFNERLQATQALEKLGPKALPALREAAKNKDPEIARRASDLVRAIEKKGQIDQLLEPTMVKLSHAGAPLKVVVADLARQSGYTVKLDKAVDAQKAVTVQTERVPFWQAFDELCQQGDLALGPVTVKGSAVIAQDPQQEMQKRMQQLQQQIQRQGRNMQILVPQIDMGGEPGASFEKAELTLVSGKPAAAPTTYVGALRVRALPLKEAENERIREHKGFLFEVCPEPKIAWRTPLELRISALTDDRGQPIEVVSVELTNQKEPDEKAGAEAGPSLPFNQQLVALARLPDQPGKTVPELKAALSGTVQGPNLPVISIPDVVKAGTKPHRSSGGDELTVHSFRQLDSGVVELQVELSTNDPSGANGQQVFQGNFQIQLGGNVGGGRVRFVPMGMAGIGKSEVQLYDENGKPYAMHVQGLNTQIGNGQKISKMTMLCEPPRDGAKPGKLVYVTSRPTSFEAPVVLKDVPLP